MINDSESCRFYATTVLNGLFLFWKGEKHGG